MSPKNDQPTPDDGLDEAEALANRIILGDAKDIGAASLFQQLAHGAGLAFQAATTHLSHSMLVSHAANAQILAQALNAERPHEELERALSLSQANVEQQIAALATVGKKAIELLREAGEALHSDGSKS